jgi:copper(I)-binding protein
MRAALLAALLAAAAPAIAAPGGIEAARPWSRPAAAGGNGAAFLTLINHGRADALVGAESPAAQKVELHASGMAGGIMTMAPEARVALPAGGELKLAPGGRHLMLIGLKRALRPGDRIAATLRFESGARLRVEFPVTGGAAPEAGDMHAMPGMH